MHTTTRTARPRRTAGITGIAAAALTGAVALGATTVPTAAADDDRAAQGTRSLAKVLAADGTGFDQRGRDFDIVEAAVLAVLDAKPDSPVGLLTDGKQRLTAFLPTDNAFRALVADLTGETYARERRVFTTVAGVGIDTVETILRYHVVAGETLGSGKVVAAAEQQAELTMASGGTITVRLDRAGKVVLVDEDTDDRNARANRHDLDINKGNRQVAHGIDRVLRPIDL